MTSNDKQAAAGLVAGALGRGCLGGLGLALLFLVISGLMYLLLPLTGLPQNVVLLLAVASGPVIGTAIALTVFLIRASRMYVPSGGEDEATEGDAP
ncbi:MAG TPA: hypothetical protein ENI95_10425 [Chloroflexi bacterium]|nr:hypothetical protein [Chloroflexota bacterium]